RGGDVEGSEGVGLGLHIVRNLVEAMGGKITVRRNSEAGSTFTCVFPQ
ncbi:MAG: ATP-binding protein, partial [Acidimicrobiia bacterium]